MPKRRIVTVSISSIKTKPQVRQTFNRDTIESLAESIRENGLINPITIDEHNALIAGERRLIACRDFLHWKDIEAIVVYGRPKENAMFLQLAENMQREDLSPNDACEVLTKIFTSKAGVSGESLFSFFITTHYLYS